MANEIEAALGYRPLAPDALIPLGHGLEHEVWDQVNSFNVLWPDLPDSEVVKAIFDRHRNRIVDTEDELVRLSAFRRRGLSGTCSLSVNGEEVDTDLISQSPDEP